MKRNAKSVYVGADAADKAAEAKLLAQNTKTGDEKGAGNAIDNGERFTCPTLSNLDNTIGSEPWTIGARSGRYPTIKLVVTATNNTEREISTSQNKFNKALRLPEFTDGKPHVHRGRWSSVLSTWFKCSYDVWFFLCWLSDQYEANNVAPYFVVSSHTDTCKKYGSTETERVESQSFKPVFDLPMATLVQALNAFFAQFPACERGECLPFDKCYQAPQAQAPNAPQAPQTPNFGA